MHFCFNTNLRCNIHFFREHFCCCACLVFCTLYIAFHQILDLSFVIQNIFFLLTYPQCNAVPMMHLCLLFTCMLIRLNPIGPLPSCARCLLLKDSVDCQSNEATSRSICRPGTLTFHLSLCM